MNDIIKELLEEDEEDMRGWEKMRNRIGAFTLYYFYLKPKDIYYNVKNGIRNLIHFFTVVWDYRDFDYSYTITLYQEGLRRLREGLVNEEDISREKKKEAIQRYVDLLELIKETNYGEDKVVEDYLSGDISYEERVKKINAKRKKVFKELNHLFAGQDFEKFKQGASKDMDESYKEWREWFDGSGIEGWWD